MLTVVSQHDSEWKEEHMASMDDIREKAEAAIDQAKPLVEGAVNAGAQFAQKADEWARSDRPAAETAFEAVSGAATGAVDLLADGANAAFEFIKDRVEEVSGKDLDGDGQVGKIRPEDVVAGAELAAEAVTDAVDKATAEISSMTPEDVVAGAELAAEAVAGAVDKAAAEISSMTPEDVAAGAELAAEAAADAIDRVVGDVTAGAELAAEALADAVDKAAGAQE